MDTDGNSLVTMDKTHKKCVLKADAGGAPVANCFAHKVTEDPTDKNCIICFPGFIL
jgi:hypothetical protein